MMIEMIRPLDIFQVGLRLSVPVASIATFHFAVVVGDWRLESVGS